MYPYQEPEWQINPDSSKLEERSVSISGSLFNNTQSGDVTFEFALNASLLDASAVAKQSMAGLGTYQAVTLIEPGAFEAHLNLSTLLDEGVRGFTHRATSRSPIRNPRPKLNLFTNTIRCPTAMVI